MTAPRSPDHLDDEAVSALLDGIDGADGADAHLDACAACAARFAALGRARDALRSATVAPLPAAVVDDLVGAALAAQAAGTASLGTPAAGNPRGAVVPMSRGRRGRRLQTPPPAWLLGAAAALAVVVGLAGLLQAGGNEDDMAASGKDSGAAMLESAVEGGGDAAGGTVADDAAAVDPEVVVRDLGDVADAGALAAVLDVPLVRDMTARTAQAARDTAEEERDGPTAGDPVASASPPPSVPPAGAATAGGAGPPDRARCRADAERIGAGRFGVLLSTATLRWAGQPAEVLVFSLTEPAGGFTRQALVLARPGCGLLADPRW